MRSFLQIDRFVRRNTIDRFGPVREVVHEPAEGLVLEVAFEGLQRSTRHKSGLAMRFPRINRLRWDKPPRRSRPAGAAGDDAGANRNRARVVSGSPRPRSAAAKLRRGRMSDLDALLALENAVFTVDLLSRRSLRHFLAAPNASLIVAEENGKLAGYALVLYPAHSTIARLYSIAVAPHIGRRGVGPLLLAGAEKAAHRRRRQLDAA